jgi:hypothetical protein
MVLPAFGSLSACRKSSFSIVTWTVPPGAAANYIRIFNKRTSPREKRAVKAPRLSKS